MGDIDILDAEGVNSQTLPSFEGFSLLQHVGELTGKGAQTDPDKQGFKIDTNLQLDLKVTREERQSEVAWAQHLRMRSLPATENQ